MRTPYTQHLYKTQKMVIAVVKMCHFKFSFYSFFVLVCAHIDLIRSASTHTHIMQFDLLHYDSDFCQHFRCVVYYYFFGIVICSSSLVQVSSYFRANCVPLCVCVCVLCLARRCASIIYMPNDKWLSVQQMLIDDFVLHACSGFFALMLHCGFFSHVLHMVVVLLFVCRQRNVVYLQSGSVFDQPMMWMNRIEKARARAKTLRNCNSFWHIEFVCIKPGIWKLDVCCCGIGVHANFTRQINELPTTHYT